MMPLCSDGALALVLLRIPMEFCMPLWCTCKLCLAMRAGVDLVTDRLTVNTREGSSDSHGQDRRFLPKWGLLHCSRVQTS